MLPTLHIRQDALQNWAGKIDFMDAAIIALIRSMDLRNPAVKALAYQGYVLLRRSYVSKMLPLLDLSEDRIGRRVKRLSKVGLVDCLIRVDPKTKRFALYARLSKLYWAAEQAADQAAEREASGENSSEATRGRFHRAPVGENAHRSSKEIKDSNTTPAAGAPKAPPPADPQQEHERSEAVNETAYLDLVAGLVARKRLDKRIRDLQDIDPAEAEAEMARAAAAVLVEDPALELAGVGG